MAIIDKREGYLFSLNVVEVSNTLYEEIVRIANYILNPGLRKITKTMFREYASWSCGIKLSPLAGKNLSFYLSIQEINILLPEVLAEAEAELVFPMTGLRRHANLFIKSVFKQVSIFEEKHRLEINENGIILKIPLSDNFYPIREIIPNPIHGNGQKYYIARCEKK
jgi:hypothetical protein